MYAQTHVRTTRRRKYRCGVSIIKLIFVKQKKKKKLDLMFMKHYAPNRCLYIKVAKLRTGVGSAKTLYLQNCSVKLFKEHFKVQIFRGR